MARKTDTVTLADGMAVKVQQLGWEQARAARKAAQQESARNLIAMGGAEFMRAWSAMNKDKAKTEADGEQAAPVPVVAAAPADILDGYDLGLVLAGGVVKPASGFLADLCEADAETLGRAILSLTYPQRTEEQEKNAPGRCTSA